MEPNAEAESHKGIKRMKPRSGNRSKGCNTGNLLVSYRAALELAVDRAEKREAFRAQHGPVRVLMKDGKWLDK